MSWRDRMTDEERSTVECLEQNRADFQSAVAKCTKKLARIRNTCVARDRRASR